MLPAHVHITLMFYNGQKQNKTNGNKENKFILNDNIVMYIHSMNFLHVVPIINKWA